MGLAPAPQPTFIPLPTPAPQPTLEAPSAAQAPTILVYPFDVETGADPKLGTAIAQIFGQEMAATGGVDVLAIPQGITRANFLENARSEKADFYISGYVMQVGDNASVVAQVVSVESGVILFSQTAQVSTVADVASQSLLARTQILQFLGRGTENVQTQTANTPAPTSTNGANVPISGITSIVDSVFKHKGSHTPPPTPAVKPARGVIVAPVTAAGTLPPGELTNAWHELYYAMNRVFNAQLTAVTSPAAQSADEICGANRNNTIATGTLQEASAGHRTQVTFVLSIYTCFGAVLEHETGKGGTLKIAVDSAVAAYAKAHPENS